MVFNDTNFHTLIVLIGVIIENTLLTKLLVFEMCTIIEFESQQSYEGVHTFKIIM